MNVVTNSHSSAREMLRSAKVEVTPETFTLSCSRGDFAELLRNPQLSPSGYSPYMVLWDRYEVTMMLDQAEIALIQNLPCSAKVETGFRLLTFDLVLDFGVVGFIAEVSGILAASGIPILPISAFSRDHLLIKQDKLAPALKVLSAHVADLC